MDKPLEQRIHEHEKKVQEIKDFIKQCFRSDNSTTNTIIEKPSCTK